MDVYGIIEELEQLVENAKVHAMGRALIDEEDFYMQTTKLRKVLPDVIKQASDVVKRRDEVLVNSESDANRLLTESQEESQRLRSDARAQADRMVQNAREDHDRIIEDARREAERIEADAREHSEQLVAENTITQRAQQAADEMHRQAVEESDDLRAQTMEWSLARLDQLEAILGKLTHSVAMGKEELAQSNESYSEEAAPA